MGAGSALGTARHWARLVAVVVSVLAVTAVAGLQPRGAAARSALVVGAGQYATIGAALAAAAPGDRILLAPGIYRESIVIDRPVALAGVAGQTVIDGGCAQLIGVTVTAPDTVIQGLEIRNVRGAGVSVQGAGAQRVTVDNNYIHDFDCDGADNGNDSAEAGVAYYYAGARGRVTNNRIYYRAAAPQQGRTNGIWFKSNSENPSGGYHTIASNDIRGGHDGIGGENEDDPHGQFDGNTTVTGNRIDTCNDDGIQVEGNTAGSVVRDNVIRNCALGLANASSAQTGTVTFANNTIAGTSPGLYGNQACMKVGNGGSQTVVITGTLCRTNGDGIQQTNSGLAGFRMSGNVWQTGRYVFEFTSDPAGGSTFDYDCLGTTDTTRFIKWGSAGRFPDLASFRQATGQEQHGTQSLNCPPPSGTTPAPSPIPPPSPSAAPPSPPAPSPSPAPPPRNATITTDADAYVSENGASQNYGSAARLLVDGDAGARRQALLRFTILPTTGPIQQATLRFRIGPESTDTAADGPAVYASRGGWSEAGVTWNSRPSRTSGALHDFGQLAAGQWITVDVSTVVRGPGNYSFTLAGPAADGTSIASRESGSPAQLLLTTGSAAPLSTSPLIASGQNLVASVIYHNADIAPLTYARMVDAPFLASRASVTLIASRTLMAFDTAMASANGAAHPATPHAAMRRYLHGSG